MNQEDSTMLIEEMFLKNSYTRFSCNVYLKHFHLWMKSNKLYHLI